MTYKEFKKQGGTLTEEKFKNVLKDFEQGLGKAQIIIKAESIPIEVINGQPWIKWEKGEREK